MAWASADILACGYADGSVALWNPTNSPKSQLLREFRAHSAAIVHISPLLLVPGAPIELLALDRGGVAKFHVLARSMWNRAQLSAKVVSSGGGASILGVPALDAHRIAALALSRDSGLAAVAPRVSSGAAGAGIIIIALPRVVAENGAIAPQRLELPPFTHSLPMESALAQPCLGWLRADSARAAAARGPLVVAAHGGEVRCWAAVTALRSADTRALWASVCARPTVAVAPCSRRCVSLLDVDATVHVHDASSGALLSRLELGTRALVLSAQIWSASPSGARVASLRGVREESPAAIRDAHVKAGAWTKALSVEVERQARRRGDAAASTLASAVASAAASAGALVSNEGLGLLTSYLQAALTSGVDAASGRAAATVACTFAALADEGRMLVHVLPIFEARGHAAALASALRDVLLELASNSSCSAKVRSSFLLCARLFCLLIYSFQLYSNSRYVRLREGTLLPHAGAPQRAAR